VTAPRVTTDRIADAAIFVVAFAVYAAGASRTIYVGDSGELATAVATLGIPHPSGYPLYVLSGKLWTLLVPVGSVAFRLSLFSAAAAALACALAFRFARTLGMSFASSLLAATLLATSESFWSQANVQRVYALNAVFVLFASFAALSWYRERTPTAFGWAAFACALGATNHTFMAAFGLTFAIFAALSEPRILVGPAYWGRGIAAVVAGLSPYLYLPIRSRMNPPLDWGNPETPAALADVVLRRSFWERAWVESPADVAAVVLDFARSLPTEITAAGTLLAATGLAAGFVRNPFTKFLALAAAANVATVAWHGSRSDIFIWHRYYIPAYIIVALLAATGWDAVARRLPRGATGLILILPVVLFARNFERFDRSNFRIADDYATAVLESIPPGSHLAASDDNILFSLLYLHWVERRRPDVNLIMQGVGRADLPPLRFDPGSDGLYLTHHPNWNVPDIALDPIGLVFRVRRADSPASAPVLPRTELTGMDDPGVPKDYLTQNLIGQFHYMIGFTFEQRDWPRARASFEAAARAAPQNDVLFYNLGLIYLRNGLYQEAIDAFERSAQINPRHIPGAKKVRASDRLQEARSEHDRIAEILADMPGNGDGLRETSAAAEYLESLGEKRAARGLRLELSHGDGSAG
jgi:tetratricopeptide (TPR) repeat protein